MKRRRPFPRRQPGLTLAFAVACCGMVFSLFAAGCAHRDAEIPVTEPSPAVASPEPTPIVDPRLPTRLVVETYRGDVERGKMYDQRGKLLVESHLVDRLSFDPKALPVDRRAKFLSDVCRQIGCDAKERLAHLTKNPNRLLLLSSELDEPGRKFVETLRKDFPDAPFPLRTEKSKKRSYYFHENLAHLLGHTGEINRRELADPAFTGFRAGDRLGRAGLELAYEENLRPKLGRKTTEVDQLDEIVRVVSDEPPRRGDDLYLTVDAELQQTATAAMQQQDRAGAVVVLDPRTGAVLALVSTPAWDPEWFGGLMPLGKWQELREDERKPLQNKAITGLYPPGSTFKVVGALAALEEQTVADKKSFTCRGEWTHHGRTFRCHVAKGHGKLDFYRAVKYSCNVYFYKLSLLLGPEPIVRFARLLGVGRATGIDLDGEKAGVLPDQDWLQQTFHRAWEDADTLNTVIGQGNLAMTPVQIAVLYVTIVNWGTVYQPYIVARVVDDQGQVIRLGKPEVVGKVPVGKDTFAKLHKALAMVVNSPGGSGYGARIKDFQVAGKTGTSQVRQIGEVRQSTAATPYAYRDHSLFAAFAPVEDPEIVVVVVVEHGGFGSVAAAPVARAVLTKYAERRAREKKEEQEGAPGAEQKH